ncbi:hypothetical protein [Nocardia bovistercoris]|uniref:Uncharacterized protein n=1 Tax=Nocardia bovistercoris TaxID=2785916 RepID=A0A931I9C0_9NOCA|nr:hypothetical protein [Nocardia bovistercoris]MBH0775728.1 hypothetical protein [Nocardia bovistercoris]
MPFARAVRLSDHEQHTAVGPQQPDRSSRACGTLCGHERRTVVGSTTATSSGSGVTQHGIPPER